MSRIKPVTPPEWLIEVLYASVWDCTTSEAEAHARAVWAEFEKRYDFKGVGR